jgi:choline-sulfatase
VSFPQIFADAGWSTLDFGKEHVPHDLHPWQVQNPQGFSMSEIEEGAQSRGVRKLRSPGMGHTVGATWPAEVEFPPTVLTRNVLEALAEQQDPFLIRASFLQPHTPVIVPEPWASRYAGVPFENERRRADEGSAFERRFGEVVAGAEFSDEEFREAQAYYHGAVSWVDDQVGQLLDALDELDLTRSTIVVLTSDHGAYLGENGAYGKHTFAPQSHRVPLLVRWPGQVQAGSRRSELAHGVDIPRTLLALAGISCPDDIGGRDLFDDPAPAHLISSIGYGAAQSRAFPNLGAGTGVNGGWPQRFCIRTQRFRLDMTTRVNGRAPSAAERDVFLADLVNDPAERVNLSGRSHYAEVEADLIEVLLAAVANAIQPADDVVYRGFVPPSPV